MKASPPAQIVIYGAGGHGQVVAEAAELLGWAVAGFVDDERSPGESVGRYAVLDPSQPFARAAVAIGDNAARGRIIEQLAGRGVGLPAIVHPAAWISPSAEVGDGVFIGPSVSVHAHAAIALGAIINTASVIEHHNVIHRYAHVAPGCVLGGGVTVGQRTLVGLGSRVLPGVAIGDDAVIGAGGVVVEPVAAGTTVGGIPARPIA